MPDIITELPAAVSGIAAVLDGEIVAFDRSGRESRTALSRKSPPAKFMVFDILAVGGEPLIGWPLNKRYAMLDVVLEPQEHVQRVPSVSGELLDEMLATVDESGMEGIVIKRSDSLYWPGKRHRTSWLKKRIR